MAERELGIKTRSCLDWWVLDLYIVLGDMQCMI